MTDITAVVKNIKKDQAKSGNTFYKVTLDNGDILFAWDYNHIRNIKIGQEAKFLVEQSKTGNFLQIRASELTDGAPEDEPWDEEDRPSGESEVGNEETVEDFDATSQADNAEPVPPRIRKKSTPKVTVQSKDDYWQKKYDSDLVKDEHIGRMSALNTACAYATYCSQFKDADDEPITEEELIDIAKRLEKFAKTGK